MKAPPLRVSVGVMGASFEAGNSGVNALAEGTVRSILRAFPDGEVFVLDYNRHPSCHSLHIEGREVSVPLVNIRFSKWLIQPNNIAILILLAMVSRMFPSPNIRGKLIGMNSYLHRIDEADFLVSLAGGDSFSDIYGLGRLFYVALPQILVLLMGKPLILMPQTLGPYHGWFAKVIAGWILKRAKGIYSRDRLGVVEAEALLRWQGSSGKVRFCYDMGFILEPIEPERLDVEGLSIKDGDASCLVGLNVSGLLYMGGYTRKNMFGLRSDYAEMVHALIEYLIELKGVRVLLVPHVFSRKDDSESDSVACEKIFRNLGGRYPGKLGLVCGHYNQNEVKYVIGQCEFFIGSRMHACIAAVSQMVPSLALAYSDKFAGVMDSIVEESLVVDQRSSDKDETLVRIGRALDDRALTRQQLERVIPQVRTQVLDFFCEWADAPRSGAALLHEEATAQYSSRL